jgi:hypothetical protein
MGGTMGWEPATDAEVALYSALAAGDQERYFQALGRINLLLPVSADAAAGRTSVGWGTWTANNHTHLLAFTSDESMRICLAQHVGGARRLSLRELVAIWPNNDWWLAVNPGLPIEGYLPAWFVAQLARGDARLPGHRGSTPRDRLERVEALERAKAAKAAAALRDPIRLVATRGQARALPPAPPAARWPRLEQSTVEAEEPTRVMPSQATSPAAPPSAVRPPLVPPAQERGQAVPAPATRPPAVPPQEERPGRTVRSGRPSGERGPAVPAPATPPPSVPPPATARPSVPAPATPPPSVPPPATQPGVPAPAPTPAAPPAATPPAGASGPRHAEPQPEFVPANAVEEQLYEAAEAGNTDAFLSTLLLATVLIPKASGTPNGQWRPQPIDGEPHIVSYTSTQHLREPLETIPIKFIKLISEWPDPNWSFAVNPGTPVGATLPGGQLLALANWAAEVGLGGEDHEPDEPDVTINGTPVAGRVNPEVTVLQKAIAPSKVGYYLERGYDRVTGFVHRAHEVSQLRSATQMRTALGLDWEGSPFSVEADEIYLLRWSAYRPSLYRIPYGGQNEAAMRAMEGWVIERAPFRGNGFAPGESKEVIAEFKVDSVRLPHGARLLRLKDSTEELIAIFDADVRRWLRTDRGK